MPTRGFRSKGGAPRLELNVPNIGNSRRRGQPGAHTALLSCEGDMAHGVRLFPLESLSQLTTGKPQGGKGLVLSELSLCTDPRSDALIRAAR